MKKNSTLFRTTELIILICFGVSISFAQGITNKDYEAIGFELEKKELLFILNNATKDIDVINFIEEPDRKSDFDYWSADGADHQDWFYNSLGLEIDFTIEAKNTLTVSAIIIKSNSVLKTSRGIGVGNTKEEVLRVYFEEINQKEINVNSDEIVAG